MRPFILFILISITGAAIAQADSSYQLLWYYGKKIRPNVLLTSGGDTVTYNPSKGTVKVISKKGDGKKMDDMLAELHKTPRRMQEMVNRLAKGLPKSVLPFYSVNVRRSYNEVNERYRDILSGSFTLPDFGISSPQPIVGKGGLPDIIEEDPWEKAYEEFRQYIADHTNDRLTNVPVPPRYDYTYCYPCEREKQGAFKKDMERFMDELRGTDNAIVLKAFGMARQAEMMLSGEKLKRARKEYQLIINFLFYRMRVKVGHLVEKYMDDPYLAGAVLEVAISTDRQFQLTGLGEALPSGYMLRALKAVSGIIEKAIAERDYPIALNLPLILSVERQMQLIGSGMAELFDKAIAFNQFKMNMNISGKVSGNGGYQLAHVKGDSWFYAVPDTTCSLQWFLVGPLLNKTKSELLASELKGNGGELKYVGAKTWNSDIPSIKIDFCSERVDSVIAYPFHPEGFQELWLFPKPWGTKDVSLASNVLLGCFIDVNRTKQDYAKYKDPQEVEKLKKEMMAQYQQVMKNYKSGNITAPKNTSLLELEPYAAAQMNSKKMSELIHKANPGRYIFEPTVHNKDQVIIKDKLNGKILFPENTATEYAWFHLTLEHDPDGPYRVSL